MAPRSRKSASISSQLIGGSIVQGTEKLSNYIGGALDRGPAAVSIAVNEAFCDRPSSRIPARRLVGGSKFYETTGTRRIYWRPYLESFGCGHSNPCGAMGHLPQIVIYPRSAREPSASPSQNPRHRADRPPFGSNCRSVIIANKSEGRGLWK